MIRGSRFNDATIHELINERIGFHGDDPKRGQGCCRKIGDVKGYNSVRNAGQGGGQDVTVIVVGQRQPLFPALIASHATAANVPVHELASPPKGVAQVRPSTQDGIDPLSVDTACPLDAQDPLPPTVDCQTHQEIA